jgi:membrane-associated protein
MQEIFHVVRDLLDPEKIIQIGGLTLVTAIIFAETGLMIGFFLPGDSLLFTVGLFCALGVLPVPIGMVLVVLSVAAIVGDQVGIGQDGFWGSGSLRNGRVGFSSAST